MATEWHRGRPHYPEPDTDDETEPLELTETEPVEPDSDLLPVPDPVEGKVLAPYDRQPRKILPTWMDSPQIFIRYVRHQSIYTSSAAGFHLFRLPKYYARLVKYSPDRVRPHHPRLVQLDTRRPRPQPAGPTVRVRGFALRPHLRNLASGPGVPRHPLRRRTGRSRLGGVVGARQPPHRRPHPARVPRRRRARAARPLRRPAHRHRSHAVRDPETHLRPAPERAQRPRHHPAHQVHQGVRPAGRRAPLTDRLPRPRLALRVRPARRRPRRRGRGDARPPRVRPPPPRLRGVAIHPPRRLRQPAQPVRRRQAAVADEGEAVAAARLRADLGVPAHPRRPGRHRPPRQPHPHLHQRRLRRHAPHRARRSPCRLIAPRRRARPHLRAAHLQPQRRLRLVRRSRQVAHRYRSGENDDDFDYVLEGLRETEGRHGTPLRRPRRPRGPRLRRWSPKAKSPPNSPPAPSWACIRVLHDDRRGAGPVHRQARTRTTRIAARR